ncbi:MULTISPECIES: hypothetical protein [Streptomyces]|uniref:Uncharacterized protein n=1 Tax=Streptomyces pratisoli TaxID=3139917 RepID=A0ACC6Q9R0_9ACTN|nr:hypothetical protein [Streptomyces sp. NBC_00259]
MLIALLVASLGVAMAVEVRNAQEREHEFRAAPECASVPVKASACLWEQDFTVRKAASHRGKRGKPPEAELVLPSGKPWHVTFRNAGPLVSEMKPDDKVAGLIWYGDVVEVRDAGGRRQQTSDGPVGWPADRLGGAIGCISFGTVAFIGGLWGLLGRRSRRQVVAAAAVRWHSLGIGAAAIVALWIQAATGWPTWSIPVGWGVLTLLLLGSAVGFVVAALRGTIK